MTRPTDRPLARLCYILAAVGILAAVVVPNVGAARYTTATQTVDFNSFLAEAESVGTANEAIRLSASRYAPLYPRRVVIRCGNTTITVEASHD